LRDINDFPIEIRRADLQTGRLAITTRKDERIDEKVTLAQGLRHRGIVSDVPEELSVMDDGCPLLRQL
jgi:hypothetical protein